MSGSQLGPLPGRSLHRVLAAALCSWCAIWIGCQPAIEREEGSDEPSFAELSREYLSGRFRFYPVERSLAGEGPHDGELGSFRHSDVLDRLAELRDFRHRLAGIDLTRLSRDGFLDALWLTSLVKAEIHELEEIAPWRRSPRFYARLIGEAVASLFRGRDLPESRLAALLSRLERVPALIETARANLEEPSRLAVEVGAAELEALREALLELTAALESGAGPERLAELGDLGRGAARAIGEWAEHLRSETLPAATADFVRGEEVLRRRLLYAEMEAGSLESLIESARAELELTRRRLDALAGDADPTEPGEPLVGDNLVSFVEGALMSVRRFTAVGQIFPASGTLRVAAVSPQSWPRRDIVLDGPGVLSTTSTDTWLLLSASPERERNAGSLKLELIAEVYPGRHLQDLFRRDAPTPLRQALFSTANREGWTAYVGEALEELGYGGEDREFRVARLRADLGVWARLIAGVRLHCGEIGLEQAAEFLRTQALLDEEDALRQARRLALGSDLMAAGIGKLRIRDIRKEVLGQGFNPEAVGRFHRAYLSLGAPPLKLVRLGLLAR